ncbi:hypothetical protein EV191_101931 [Tamaricihabitans halophyticus]|uniref:DUF4097 domain-containing protein n=1 Tax=Tamaricihabitans halophyticus TaxID=1262583 RepID=A0A4R2RB97_9PSEU|nr:DUF4097 family beta strand repeat-containing protein [Tamaricihabitans halophyticus]TCP56981.1 hypothetical protein EV191_101931 [Tamaricihabitans halophyticus]
MRTFTHTTEEPMHLVLSAGSATQVTVYADATITAANVVLEPVQPGDPRATEVIERAWSETAGPRLTVRLPDSPATNGMVTSSNGTVHVNSVVSHGGVTIVDGQVITNTGRQLTPSGGVRVIAYVPRRSFLTVTTAAARLDAEGTFEDVDVRTVSGEIAIGTARDVHARTMSGGVLVRSAQRVHGRSVSGDVRVARFVEFAKLNTTSGDIAAHATGDALVRALSVSGDIDITHDPGVSVAASVRSVSGRVRQPR